MPRRLWWVRILWALCCLGLLASACASSTTVAESPTGAPEPVQDAPDEASEGTGVPFPPAENLVEWDDPSEDTLVPFPAPEQSGRRPPASENSRAIMAAALRDPLAVGLADPERIDELIGGQWQLEFAAIAESDSLPALPCSADGPLVRFETRGIHTIYEQDDFQTLVITIRRGPDVPALFDAIFPSLECLVGEVTDVAFSTGGPEDQIVAATVATDASDPDAPHRPYVTAIRGDLLVGANLGDRTVDGALEDIPRLAELVSEILANTP